METKEILLSLRNARGLSQKNVAEKVYVTRQAVSRWETGETVPNTGTSAALGTSYGGSGQNADPDERRSFVPERSETHDNDSRGIVSEDVLLIAIILMLLGEGGDNYEVLLVLMILFAAGL